MKQSLFKFLHGIFFILCVDLIGAGLWSWAVVRSFEDSPPKASMAVVLSHDFNKETGELGSETLRRLNYVLDLYREGTVDYILCVGGAKPRFNFFGSELMRQFLIDKGVLEGTVFSEKKSFDSKTNWHMAYETAKNLGWDKFIVVSSPFHLHRFRAIIRDAPERHLEVFYSPYSLKYSRPSITYFNIWMQVHYESLAYFFQLLPAKMYNALVYHTRGQ
ncbi:MAG: YdcF family protein [Candidatus Omnitrophica bacterium]|nr:YdcF family protein [Candidatus Omnitrophota bacterium]